MQFVNIYFGFKLIGLAVGLLVLLLAIALFLYVELPYAYKQRRCRHTSGVHETMPCDAICKECGKNLGFIGTDENKIRRQQ